MEEQKKACFWASPRFAFWAIGGAVFFFALGLRLFRSFSLPCPLPVDAAYYYSVGENLHQGRGFVIDYAWNYLRGVPKGFPIPSNDYWQPLVSIILALVFAVAPVSWATAQAVAVLFGALTTFLAFWFAQRLSGSLLLGLLAGIFVAILPEAVMMSYTSDTSVFFSVFAGAALMGVVFALRESPRWLLAVGALSGLAYLTRSDGALILLTATLSFLWFSRRRPPLKARPEVIVSVTSSTAQDPQPSGEAPGTSPPTQVAGAEQEEIYLAAPFPWRWVLGMWGIFLVLIAPWLVRNYLVFGSPLAGGFLKVMLISKYGDFFTSQPEKLTLHYYLSQGTPYNFFLKVLTLGHCMRSLTYTYGWPLLGLALWELCAGGRRRSHFPVLFHLVFVLFLTSFVLTLVALKGTFHHMSPVFIPILPAFALLGIKRLWHKVRLAKYVDYRWAAVVAFLVISGLSGLSLIRSRPTDTSPYDRMMWLQKNIYEYMEQKGVGDRPVFSDNPWHYYYFNHKPAYAIPIDPYPRIKEVAKMLGIEYFPMSPGIYMRFEHLYEDEMNDPFLALVAIIYPFKDLPNSEFAAGLQRADLEKQWSGITQTLKKSGTGEGEVESTMVFEFLDPDITGQTLSAHEMGRIHNRSGLMLIKVGQVEQAANSFKKAVRCAPDVSDTYYNLARALFDLGREIEGKGKRPPTLVAQYQEALLNIEKACQMAPEREDFARLKAKIKEKAKL